MISPFFLKIYLFYLFIYYFLLLFLAALMYLKQNPTSLTTLTQKVHNLESEIYKMNLSLPLSTENSIHTETNKLNPLIGTCILWKHKIVWNGLPGDIIDLYPLLDYLTDPETGKMDDGFIDQVKPKGEVKGYI